ncbi:hypothetical protein ACFOEE_08830 [Pseudoalteromonas fenneropenaei]|uniref:Uncharacterized protein n=1 Tax=Pseudoalteromonas fenneropenaei TaxID=1737459 RepID=A0ABV7CJ10_9GAMM
MREVLLKPILMEFSTARLLTLILACYLVVMSTVEQTVLNSAI